jgi:hypothetical protein
MADMRSIATSIEEFSIDENQYPAIGGWTTIDALAPYVTPMYIRTLPTQDAWGNPMLVWCDGQSYRIVSPGGDGEIERDWTGDVTAGKNSDPDDDIVFGDGSFVRWYAKD